MQDGAAVTGLAIAAASLVAVNTTGNAIYDPIGSIIVGNLLGMVSTSHLSLFYGLKFICARISYCHSQVNCVSRLIYFVNYFCR